MKKAQFEKEKSSYNLILVVQSDSNPRVSDIGHLWKCGRKHESGEIARWVYKARPSDEHVC